MADFPATITSRLVIATFIVPSIGRQVARVPRLRRAHRPRISSSPNRWYGLTVRTRCGVRATLVRVPSEPDRVIEAERKAQVEARFLDAYAALMQAIGGGIPVTSPLVKGMQQ